MILDLKENPAKRESLSRGAIKLGLPQASEEIYKEIYALLHS